MKKNIILTITSVIVFFLILEVIFRIFGSHNQENTFFINLLSRINIEANQAVSGSDETCYQLDEVLFWKMRPNLVNCELDPVGKEYINTNQYGLRGENFSIDKPQNQIRILALGDSVTYGMRVPDYRDTFSYCLEGELNYDPQFSPNVRVINAGVSGYSSYQGLRYLEKNGLAFHPDLIIVSFGYNDATLRRASDLEIGNLKRKITEWDILPSKIMDSLYRRSAFVRGLNYWLYKKIIKRGLTHRRVSESEYEDNLENIVELARKNNIQVILLAPPYRKIFNPKDDLSVDLSGYVEKMREVARRNHIPFVFDPILTPLDREQNATFFADDVHPNENGHALIAEMLTKIIKKTMVKKME